VNDERDGLIPIGQFSAICRLTIKALRHYDDRGVLRPAFVDPHSGYRYYRPDQVATAELIRTLRAAEMPLDEIAAIVLAPGTVEAQDVIARHRQRLRDHITAQQAAIATLGDLLSPAGKGATYTIETPVIPAQLIISQRLTVRMEELGAAIGRAIAATQLLIAEQNGHPSGAPFTIYHTGLDHEEAMVIEVGWPIATPLRTAAAIGQGLIAGGPIARTIHHGPYERIGGAFAAIAAWIQQHRREMAGAPWESYLTAPSSDADPSPLATAVSWPIR
jgi:DNA-binding transcriptional MerR regulator